MKCKESVACLIVLLNLTGVIVLASSAAYDSVECDPNSNRARTGRARLIESIPCDLSKQSYCNLPGESYPWNAVKRFVYDNQGLVRRMYGDMRHIFVMQSELENEIDFDDIKHTADKYSKTFNNQHKQHQQQQPRARQMRVKKSSPATAATTKRNVVRKNYRSGDTNEPHFRPAQRPSATNSKQRTKPPKANVNEQSEKNSLIDNFIQTNVDALSSTKLNEKATSIVAAAATTTKLSSIALTSSTIHTTTSATPNASTSEIMNDESGISSSTIKLTDDESDRRNSVDMAVLDLFANISSASSTLSSTLKSTIVSTSSLTETSTTQMNEINETSERPTIMLKNNFPLTSNDEKQQQTNNDDSAVDENEDDEDEEEEEEILSDLTASESFLSTVTTSDKIDDKEQTSKDSSLTPTTEAQLYQDHAAAPGPEAATVNKRGVNACPVKEEVVAPFWGNNTRGEILALLNVYPFEQYINWEKCTHEHEQMYCRKGCRCEQQYRLHRLLAYNPLDACRGIFSDWFRFPSCCICKCYDIPLDYRVTSRSPRSSNKVLDATNENDEADEEFSLFDNDEDENYFDDDL